VRRARRAGSYKSDWDCPRLHRQQTFALQLFAGELAGATDGFRLLPDSPLGGFFVMAAEFHFAGKALPPHFLPQSPERLVDIVGADENLRAVFLFDQAESVQHCATGIGRTALRAGLLSRAHRSRRHRVPSRSALVERRVLLTRDPLPGLFLLSLPTSAGFCLAGFL
jgi:hypothetical protein